MLETRTLKIIYLFIVYVHSYVTLDNIRKVYSCLSPKPQRRVRKTLCVCYYNTVRPEE